MWGSDTGGVEGSDADDLQVDTTHSQLTGNGLKLRGTTIANTGAASITIDKIRVDWDGAGSADITKITIHGETFWSGSEPAGETLDGIDHALAPSAPGKHITFRFDSDMSGKTFTIKFILEDGSEKEMTITAGVWGSDTDDVLGSGADNLQVDTTHSRLTPRRRGLIRTKVTNTGDHDITIDKISVDWDDAGSANIARISIRRGARTETFWTGSQPAGETLDGSDYTLVSSDWIPDKHISFWFDSDMSGNTFTIKFILGDGSEKEVIIAPD